MAINIPIVTAFADKGIKEAEKAFGKFGKTGVAVGAAFAAVSAAVVAGIGLSVKAAAEDERSQKLLETQLYNTLKASQKTTKATEDFVGQMELASGVADNDLRVALGNLVRSTGDLTTAQDLLGLSLNISTATGKDLESVSIALGKASMGQFTALSKLGIPLDENAKKTKDFAAIQSTLDKQFGGASAAAADTFGGQLARLGTVWDNLTESIGYAILNNKYVKDAIGLLPNAVDKAIASIGEKGLAGAFGVFLDNMGIVGAYVSRFSISFQLAFTDMALHAFNSLKMISGMLFYIVPQLRKFGDELRNSQLMLGLELQANGMYIQDLTNIMNENEAQTKRTANESERWAQYVESLGIVMKTGTSETEKLTGAAGKADPKIKAMADRIKEAASALNENLNNALENARTALTDAQSAFDDFGKSVSDGLKNAFSFKDAKNAGDETGAGFLAGLRDQVKGIQTYSTDIEQLLKRGLSQESLNAVLAAGGESGAAIAHELVLGAQENITGPNGVNALVKSAQEIADRIGLSAANEWYGAGVSNAQSYLQGVEAAFAIAQTRLAKKGLKLPDIKGIGASFSESIAGPSVAPINMPPEQGGGIPGGGSVVVNVNGVMTNAQTGQAVLDALTQYTQVYGPLNLAIR